MESKTDAELIEEAEKRAAHRSEMLAGEIRFHLERAETKRQINQEVNLCIVELDIEIAKLRKASK